MNEIRLSDYAAQHTQQGAARALGWTQSAVWQALQAGRDIYIVEHDDGGTSAYEVRHLAGERVTVRPAPSSEEAA